MQGKQLDKVTEAHAGDIIACVKLKETQTGDSLCDKQAPIVYDPVEYPEAAIAFAIEPKSRQPNWPLQPLQLKPSCGTPFHSLQATSQALQPMQRVESVKKPVVVILRSTHSSAAPTSAPNTSAPSPP